jgi:DNA-binding MarR family transcriptional regulator
MEFDKLVHQPTRLQVFAYLYRHGETGFSALVEDLDLTEGNLASHLQRMEEAGAVAVHKEFVDRKPRTTYELTGEGQELFEEHVETLEALIDGLEE